jgi:transposase
MYQYAINMLFAGTHNVKRKIKISENRKQLTYYPDNSIIKVTTNFLETKILNKTTAYIKINNSLGN